KETNSLVIGSARSGKKNSSHDPDNGDHILGAGDLNAPDAPISGGLGSGNVLDAAGGTYRTISGGRKNTIGPNADSATIGGGGGNHILGDADVSTIAGG